MRVGAATDLGMVREVNEDNFIAGDRVFVVADGMGGHAAGEVASGVTVERMATLDDRDDLAPDVVHAELIAANGDILDSAAEHPEQAGMGTTVAGVVAVSISGAPHWVAFNVGDCRVYRLADGELRQLTVDHTEVAELVASGTITPEEAKRYPRRNVVTRALGSNPAPRPDIWVVQETGGEVFLVCSDGLCSEVDDDEIAEVLLSADDPQDAAERLVAAAVEAGGHDNVTVIVVAVD